MKYFTEEHLVVPALYPDADLYAADPATDIINTKNYDHVTFILTEGAGGTGTVKIQVEECDDTTPTNSTAIAFNYRVATTPDTWGAITASASTGYTTTAGANKQVAVEIDAAELTDGYPYVRLQLTEVADSPCDAGVIAILSRPRYAQDVLPGALT
jgi:hypothetical protein